MRPHLSRGRTAFLALVLGTLACKDGNSPTSPTSSSCANIGGSWTGTYANSCGGSSSGPTAIAQAGCNVTFSAQGIAGEGTVSGSVVTFTARDGCATNIRGMGTVHSTTSITATYTGTSSGALFCCPAGNFAGSIALTR